MVITTGNPRLCVKRHNHGSSPDVKWQSYISNEFLWRLRQYARHIYIHFTYQAFTPEIHLQNTYPERLPLAACASLADSMPVSPSCSIAAIISGSCRIFATSCCLICSLDCLSTINFW